MTLRQRLWLMLAIVFSTPALASAGVVVIAHPSVSLQMLDAEQVAQLYLGRVTALPDGTRPVVLDLMEGDPQRVEFSERVLGKSEQQLRSYWTRMIFTGKGQPPRTVSTKADMLRVVSATPGAIGYIDSGDVTAKIKVLFRIE